MVKVLSRIRGAALQVKLRTLFAIGAVGLPLVLLLIAGLVTQQIARSNLASKNLARLTPAYTAPRTLLALLEDAEGGQRGYLLTSRPRYLEPYHAAVARANAALKNLDKLVAVDPAAAPEVAALRLESKDKLEELAQTVRLTRLGFQDSALAIVQSDMGESLMDNIRHNIAELRARIAGPMAAAQADREQSALSTEELIGALLAGVALFGVFTALVIWWNLKERERIIAEKDTTDAERADLVRQLGAERERLISTVEQLMTAKRAADEANRAKSEFLASMSHELRTPLNAILGFSEVIRDELYGPVGLAKYVDYASDVHKSGQHLLDLINDVLDLSKIDAGKVELREEVVEVGGLIEDCVVLVRERALKGGVGLVVAADPGFTVRADLRLMKQILLNLLSNAIKFTPKAGTVLVTTLLTQDGLVISVQDSGIGMSEEEIDTAMSAYGQIDSQVARKHHGTGLGLPIARSLAELHGGSLSIDSSPGKGTRVQLRLPTGRLMRPGEKIEKAEKIERRRA